MYQRQVSFGEAIKMAVQQNYCNFSGRSSRSEYWWFCLFSVIVGTIASAVGGIFGDNGSSFLGAICSLVLLLPSLGVSVRRLHDINKSGWWYLLNLLPIVGQIILIVWAVKDSDPTENEYGPVPNIAQ